MFDSPFVHICCKSNCTLVATQICTTKTMLVYDKRQIKILWFNFVFLDCPRVPVLNPDDCTVSNNRAHIRVTYNETVRVRRLQVFYTEASCKGQLQKDWDCIEASGSEISGGVVGFNVTKLQPGTMYKAYAIASNDIGESQPSDELWFRTIDTDAVEMRIIAR
jgi:hypothetical protein